MEHHQHTKAVLNRTSRAIGHLSAIKGMIEEGRDCSEILIQLSAVRAEINGIGRVILQDHMEHCITHAVKENDEEAVARLIKAIDQFI